MYSYAHSGSRRRRNEVVPVLPIEGLWTRVHQPVRTSMAGMKEIAIHRRDQHDPPRQRVCGSSLHSGLKGKARVEAVRGMMYIQHGAAYGFCERACCCVTHSSSSFGTGCLES